MGASLRVTKLTGVGLDLGVALIGTAPIHFLSHRLQHLDYHVSSMSELLDTSDAGLLMTV